ncbi:MAG: hypothetical protein IJI57_11345 [Flexilinea sp.]|nr:hypothetical protein [Flexilinea sp.]
MFVRPSSALRNDYTLISSPAKKTGESICITNKGEGDGVFVSTETCEECEKKYLHRDKIYLAEFSRLNGDPVFTQAELDEKMKTLFRNC